MKRYVIQPKEEGKGRSFGATLAAVVTAYGLFPEGNDGKTIRPVWALFAGTDAELGSFAANLKGGRKAQEAGYNRKGDDERIEFLKKVRYQTYWQRESEGSLVTFYHPELFRLDPGLIDPEGVHFVLLVPSDWSQAQQVDAAAPVRHVRALSPHLDEALLTSMVPAAYLFAAYLDRRTRCPLVADGRFYLQLLTAALEKGIASLPGNDIRHTSMYSREEWGRHAHHSFDIQIGDRYDRLGLDAIGLQHAISVRAKHAEFEAFLAEQVTLFYSRAKKSRLRASRVDVSKFVNGVDG